MSLRKNKRERRKYNREWARKNPEKRKANERRFNKKHPGYRSRYSEKRRKEIIQFANWLRDRPCTDCGGRFPSFCMQFDHCRGNKRWEVTTAAARGWKRFLEELKKCDVVCANCHCVRTAIRRHIKDHKRLIEWSKQNIVARLKRDFTITKKGK